MAACRMFIIPLPRGLLHWEARMSVHDLTASVSLRAGHHTCLWAVIQMGMLPLSHHFWIPSVAW